MRFVGLLGMWHFISELRNKRVSKAGMVLLPEGAVCANVLGSEAVRVLLTEGTRRGRDPGEKVGEGS